jgi:hypothetical protein
MHGAACGAFQTNQSGKIDGAGTFAGHLPAGFFGKRGQRGCTTDVSQLDWRHLVETAERIDEGVHLIAAPLPGRLRSARGATRFLRRQSCERSYLSDVA